VTGVADSGWRRWMTTAAFLAPALVLLGVWIVYPTIETVIRSFFGRDESEFVGFDNYQTLFTTDTLVTAIRNNAIWVAVVPALVAAIGMIFAVLTERIRWTVAFRTAVFMPMAISMFAAGVIWHIMLDKDPEHGAVNAAIGVVRDAVAGGAPLESANPSQPKLTGSAEDGFVLRTPLQPGDTAALGLTAIPEDGVPSGAKPAAEPQPAPDAISGTVWRDFKPGGGEPGVVEQGEVGIPGATVQLRSADGDVVAESKTNDDGTFAFSGLDPGTYRAAISSDTFSSTFEGVSWLGPSLITPSVMIAYIWVWAGFAMVVLAAGLSAIPRDTLEAARTDGATEWQVFRRITVPLLAPVLAVVFVTMIINVLKVFDIVLSVAPGSTQDDANVIALAMWRTSFSGVNDFGLGSAIAVLLFALVIPALALNIRRFKREEA
jgi:alpha-glucoside transport system permease protein